MKKNVVKGTITYFTISFPLYCFQKIISSAARVKMSSAEINVKKRVMFHSICYLSIISRFLDTFIETVVIETGLL